MLLSLVLCGTVVYARDLWFVTLGVNTWVWKSGGYFEGMTLSATVLTLLLAFRVSRLVSRASEEGGHTFVAFRNLDRLVHLGVIQTSVLEHVFALDRSRNPSVVRGNYIQVAVTLTWLGEALAIGCTRLSNTSLHRLNGYHDDDPVHERSHHQSLLRSSGNQNTPQDTSQAGLQQNDIRIPTTFQRQQQYRTLSPDTLRRYSKWKPNRNASNGYEALQLTQSLPRIALTASNCGTFVSDTTIGWTRAQCTEPLTKLRPVASLWYRKRKKTC